jgi:hypothetical protein
MKEGNNTRVEVSVKGRSVEARRIGAKTRKLAANCSERGGRNPK